MPDSFAFIPIGSGSGTGSFRFGSRSLAGIGNTSEPGYVNPMDKEIMASGRFNIGEDVRWTSFSGMFDGQGLGEVPATCFLCCSGGRRWSPHPLRWYLTPHPVGGYE